MNEMIAKIQGICRYTGVNCVLVNATNTWLEETPEVKDSAVFALTGFSGDTGDCLITDRGECFLFVDGRYHIQADKEVKDGVEVVKLQLGQKQDEEIAKRIKKKSTFAVVGSKVSVARLENFQKLLTKNSVKLEILQEDVVLNAFCRKKIIEYLPKISVFSRRVKTGCKPRSFKAKVATFISNLDDVAYLTQMRDFKVKNGASRVYGYLFIDKNGKQKLLKNLAQVERFLKKQSQPIALDKRTTSVYVASLVKQPVYEDNKVVELRAIKTTEELKALQRAFAISDKALLATRRYIETSKKPISEFDICENLKSNFKKYGASGLSFRPTVAINKNSALAHYGENSKKVFLKNGDLVLIDCGVYGREGLATDTTRVFVKGQPDDLQKRVYTLVLKAFLNAYVMNDKTGFEMNALAHKILDKKIVVPEVKMAKSRVANRTDKKNKNSNDIDFFVFNHGLGHGIGISVHEIPPSLSGAEIAKQPFKENMCFTIEPGLYHCDFFGIRLENSFFRKNGKNCSLTKIGFESKMIVFDMLNDIEKKILENFVLL